MIPLMRCRLRRIVLWGSATFAPSIAALLVSTQAAATPPASSEVDLKAARDLFVQAEHDEDDGRWDRALEKLQRVRAVKSTAGVRYHIGLCEAQLGLLATALADYGAAELQAKDENARDVLAAVGAAIAALTARAPRLVVHVTPGGADTVTSVDGVVVTIARLGSAMAVDPGVHTITASEPGHESIHATVTMAEGQVTFVDVVLPLAVPPDLRTSLFAADKEAPRTAESAPSRHPAASRTGAIVLSATALFLGAAGAGAYAVAATDHADGLRTCQVPTTSADQCEREKGPVRIWDWLAAGAWMGATIAATVGVVLWTQPTAEARDASARIAVGIMGPALVGVSGSF
jgi:tetratricopeptide (TPR) repeat protein